MDSSGWVARFYHLSHLHCQTVVGIGQTIAAVTAALAAHPLTVELRPYCRGVTYIDPPHGIRQLEAGAGEIDGELSTGAFPHVAEAVPCVAVQLGSSLGLGESEVFNWKDCVESYGSRGKL